MRKGTEKQDGVIKDNDSHSPSIKTTAGTVTNNQSQPIGKIFVEHERGFRVIECNDFYQKQAPVPHSPVSVALRLESCFHTFSNFCHGLLAGISLWQSIVAYQLSSPNFQIADFVMHYGALSQPLQTLFYFLSAICTVSAFDRFDLGSIRLSTIKQVFLCQSKTLIVLIYPIALLLNLSISTIDEKFCIYRYNISTWNSTYGEDVHEDILYWKSLNFARCITVILGWLVVSIEPNSNSLLDNLQFELH